MTFTFTRHEVVGIVWLIQLLGGGGLGVAGGAEPLVAQVVVATTSQASTDAPSAGGLSELSTASIQALAISSNGVMYAGSFGHGVFRTHDRGATWSRVGDGVTDPFILSVMATKQGILYVGTFRGGVFRSRDQGDTWESVNGGLKRLEVKALMSVEREVYAGTGDGVYRLQGDGDHWRPVTTGLDDVLVHSLARAADGTLFAGTSGKGIFRLAPRSSGWVRVRHGLKDHEGMIENFIRVLVIDQDQSILAGTFDGGVFRSLDGGLTWRSISRALPNDSIRGIVLHDHGLIVATGHGIFKTVDQGKQWTPLNTGLTNLSIQALIRSGEGGLYAGTSSGVFRSDDGLSWIAVNQGLEAGIAPPPFLFR